MSTCFRVSVRAVASTTISVALIVGSAAIAFAAPPPVRAETGTCIAATASATRGAPPHLAFGEPGSEDFPFICPQPHGIAMQAEE